MFVNLLNGNKTGAHLWFVKINDFHHPGTPRLGVNFFYTRTGGVFARHPNALNSLAI